MSNETEWVLVPREPTEAMLSAAHYELADKPFSNNAERSERAYAAMLAAAPQPPAEAQPVAWRSQGKSGWTFTDMPHARDIAVGIWEPLYSAPPPSAPVGVEGLIEAAKAAESMLRTVHECASHECEDCREHAGINAKQLRDALAQQPAPVAPVGVEAYLVERLTGTGYGSARSIVDAATYNPTEPAFWIDPEAQARHRVTPLVSALAKQPAAVDEAMERAAEEIERYEHTFISTVGASAIIRKHMRSAQQGDES